MRKRIFTFWEPKAKIPAYLQLCLKTWQKFLPDYEIILLDYENLENYLSNGYYDSFLYKNFSLPVQTDALRCALLKKYGGIWLDLDTIITSPKVNELLSQNADMIMIGPHIAFISAKKETKPLNIWEKEIKTKILEAKVFQSNYLNKIFHPKIIKSYKVWNYLGNSILDAFEDGIYRLDREEIKAMPEYSKALEISPGGIRGSLCKNYQNFYFKNDFSDYALNGNKGIILLHNSWTPKKYVHMDEKEFLNQNNTISEIFKKIL